MISPGPSIITAGSLNERMWKSICPNLHQWFRPDVTSFGTGMRENSIRSRCVVMFTMVIEFLDPTTLAMQSTAIRVGKLLVLTYSSRATMPGLDVDPTLFAVKHGLHLIWPLAATGLNTSPLRRLTKAEVIEVAWQFSGRLNPRHPKPTWPPQPDLSPFVVGRRYSPLIK
jgi:hypothetical protein